MLNKMTLKNQSLASFLTGIFLTSTLGCNIGSVTSTERVPYNPSAGPVPATENNQPTLPAPRSDMGGSHTGGGNGIDGRPNEAYVQDITILPEYEKYVQPRMTWLRIRLPNFANILEHITSSERLWYFTPTSLEPIESVILGVPIYGGDSDQLALQDKSEIWIAKKSYEKMNLEEKAVLLMHEMVMGARLMEFQRGYDKCLALAAKDLDRNRDQDQVKENRRNCGFQYPKAFDFGKEIVNSRELTQAVRSLVSKLMAPNFQSLEPAELKNWLLVNNFIF